MSRVRALWISAIVTVALVLVVGALVMRPALTESAGNPPASTATLVTGEQGQPASGQQPTRVHDDDHDDDEHESSHHGDHDDHDDHEDHDDDD